MLYPGYI